MQRKRDFYLEKLKLSKISFNFFFVGFFPFDIFEAISTLGQEIQVDSSKDIRNYSRRPGNINVGPGP